MFPMKRGSGGTKKGSSRSYRRRESNLDDPPGMEKGERKNLNISNREFVKSSEFGS